YRFLAGRRKRLGLRRQESEDKLGGRPLALHIDPHRAAGRKLAEQHLLGQRLLEMFLDDSRQRAGTEQTVISLLCQPATRTVAELDEHLAIRKLHLEFGHELVDDPAHAFRVQIVELDSGIETIAELGREKPV